MLLHKPVDHDARVRREAATLAAAGHEVVVLELHPRRDRPGDLPPGVDLASAAPPRWIVRLLPFHLYRLAFLVVFVRRILQLAPDVIHAHDAAMLLPGIVARRLTGTPLVYDSHELATSVPYRDRAWERFVELIEAVAVPRCRRVITVSDGIADRLRERYGLARRPSVVRNVSALHANGRPARLRERLGLEPGARLVLHQGAPATGRGGETLIRALARLDPAVRLVFLGTGEPGMAERLHALAGEVGVAERVRFLPSLPLGDLLSATAEADVGVSLLQDTCENHRLALPNKVFDYIAAGVPVVASDLPELRGLIRGYGVGWTAQPDDPVDVARALERALGPTPAGLKARLAAAHGALNWGREQERLLATYDFCLGSPEFSRTSP